MSVKASQVQKAWGLMLPLLIGVAGVSVADFGSVVISQTVSDRKAEADRLLEQGNQQSQISDHEAALQSYHRALVIYRGIGDRNGEANALGSLSNLYLSLSDYNKAIIYYQQALLIFRQVKGRNGQANTLMNLGIAYLSLSDYSKAIIYYQQALSIFQQVKDRDGQAKALNNLGIAYLSLSDYSKAITYYQQALPIFQQVKNRNGEAYALMNLGIAYRSLSDYSKAITYCQQALSIFQQVKNRNGEAYALMNLGIAYLFLSDYSKAITYYQQALLIYQQVKDRNGEAHALNNLGIAYFFLSDYSKAIAYYQQALPIYQQVKDRNGHATVLNNLGIAYFFLSDYSKAITYYQQALPIFRAVKDRSGEGSTLSNIGDLLKKQKQPELAIVFYKESVNIYESIRSQLKTLPKEQQQSYAESISKTYRNLADLLLQQNRILEAQQVLDLLKVQELNDYLRNVRGTGQKPENLPKEAQFWQPYSAKLEEVVRLGQDLAELENQAKIAALTPQQQQHKAQIEAQLRTVTKVFIDFINSKDVQPILQNLARTTESENLNPKLLRAFQDNLKELKNVAVIYPLILDDRLELILVAPNVPPVRQPVPVTRKDLNAAILAYRRALTDPTIDAKAPAQKLYNWLIKPLEPALKTANTKTILYAPDGQLRYIPLAALHDGNQWLIQRYQINNITALSLTDLGKASRAPKILVAAYTDKGQPSSFNVGTRRFTFQGLKYAGAEVEAITQLFPNSTKLLDNQFSLQAILDRMTNYSILHFATHAEFLPGQPEESFILFGKQNDRVTLRDLQTWNLPNTDLVVLSACETGKGGELGDGREILGFGYLVQETGARASLSTLWQVDDGGTQALMNAFYGALQTGRYTKTEALQAAQTALITGNYESVGGKRGLGVVADTSQAVKRDRLDHPYYWAPFVLIGNGL